MKNQGKPCPLCRQSFKVPKEGVNKLPTNLALRDILDASDSGSDTEKYKSCPKHGRALMMLCMNCRVGACTLCLGEHQGHSVVDIKEGYRELCQVIKEKVKLLEEKKHCTLNEKEKCLQHVENQYQEIKKLLENWKQDAHGEVDRLTLNGNMVIEKCDGQIRELCKLEKSMQDQELCTLHELDTHIENADDFVQDFSRSVLKLSDAQCDFGQIHLKNNNDKDGILIIVFWAMFTWKSTLN